MSPDKVAMMVVDYADNHREVRALSAAEAAVTDIDALATDLNIGTWHPQAEVTNYYVQSGHNPDESAGPGKRRTQRVPVDTLYAINDALTQLAQRFNVRQQFAAGADNEYDEMLDDATHAVRAIFWPDEQ